MLAGGQRCLQSHSSTTWSASLVDAHWWMEGLVGIGPVKMGIPGLLSLMMYLVPMLEVVPTIKRERAVRKLPLLPYSAMVSAGLTWSTYGWLTSTVTVTICNVVSVLLGLYYCHVFCSFCPQDADWLPSGRRSHFVAMALTAIWCLFAILHFPSTSASSILGITGNILCIVMFGGPLVAVQTVLKEQSTRNLPFGLSCAVTLNGGVWVIYSAAMLHDPMVLLPNLMGFVLGLLQLSLFLRFGIHSEYQAAPVSDVDMAEARVVGIPSVP